MDLRPVHAIRIHLRMQAKAVTEEDTTQLTAVLLQQLHRQLHLQYRQRTRQALHPAQTDTLQEVISHLRRGHRCGSPHLQFRTLWPCSEPSSRLVPKASPKLPRNISLKDQTHKKYVCLDLCRMPSRRCIAMQLAMVMPG